MTNTPFFIHITDLHLRPDYPNGWPTLEQFVEQVNAMNPVPDFVMVTGDIIFGNMRQTTDPAEGERDFRHYAEIISALRVPVCHAVGNHDMIADGRPLGTGPCCKTLFERYCGKRYRSFDWQDYHCVILDQWLIKPAEDGGVQVHHAMDDEQFAWLADDLAHLPAGTGVLLFCHHHLQNPAHAGFWDRLKPALPDRLRYTEICGCDHMNAFWQNGNFTSYTTVSFCGAWWAGPAPDGSPAGYALFFNTPAGLKPYYKPNATRLAVASPLHAQIVSDRVTIDTYDPFGGTTQRKEIFIAPDTAGCFDIPAGENQTVTVFVSPRPGTPRVSADNVRCRFRLHETDGTVLHITLNDAAAVAVETLGKAGGTLEVALPDRALCQWNTLKFSGPVTLRSPELVIDGRAVPSPLVELLEEHRPQWFENMDGLTLIWEIAGDHKPTPFRIPRDTFYYPANPND